MVHFLLWPCGLKLIYLGELVDLPFNMQQVVTLVYMAFNYHAQTIITLQFSLLFLRASYAKVMGII